MGGIGSRRIYQTDEVKPIVESNISLNITQLKKQGQLTPGQCLEVDYFEDCQLLLSLKIRIEEVSLVVTFMYQGVLRNQTIEIANVRCFERFYRQYLVCPVCGTHRNQLYLDSTGKFACRNCNGFGYQSQRLNPYQRHAYNAEKLRKKKFKTTGASHSIFTRPKHMKTKTHQKLVDRIIGHEKKSSELFMGYFRNIKGKFDRQNLPGSLAA
jgi:hypothetical protein